MASDGNQTVTKQQGNAAIKQVMGPVEWGMLLFLSLLWGGSFLFVGVAVSELPTLTIVFTRVGLAAAALWLVIFATGRSLPKDPKVWLAFLIMGLLNNVLPFGLIVWGQQTIASGLASILTASTPFFAVLVAGVFLHDERITGRKMIGVAVGFVGVVVMIGADVLSGFESSLLAQLAILGSALSYGFASVFGRRFKVLGVDPVVTAAGQVTASTLVLLPMTLMVDAPLSLPMPSWAVVASMVALALLSTSLAYILYFQILQRAGATNLLLVTFLVPISAILLGALILGERLDWPHFAGMVLIGLGLAAIDGRLLNWCRS